MLWMLFSFSIAACGGAKPAASPPTPVAVSAFELGEITVFDGNQAMMKIHANGTTELAGHKGTMVIEPGKTASSDSLPLVWEAGPTLQADGSIVVKGERRVQVRPDGSVQDLVHGTAIPIVITAERGTIQHDGKTFAIELAADGKITLVGGTGKPDVAPRVEGADSPGKRRVVLALMTLMLTGGKAESTVVGPATP